MGTESQKREFVEHCFRKAEEATKEWTDRLAAHTDLKFEDPAYRDMWKMFNTQAGLVGMPA
jgi:hypothetical protein